MLVNRKLMGVIASIVLLISLPLYLYANQHVRMSDMANFKTSINFQNMPLQTEPNAGKFSNDYSVQLPWEGEYSVDYYVNAKILSEIKSGINIGQCDAIRYLGKDFSQLTNRPMLSGYTLKDGPNTLSTKFHYDGVGPVFLRCYIGTPIVTLELIGADVSYISK